MTGLPFKSLFTQENDLLDRVDRVCEDQPGLHALKSRVGRGQELVEFALIFPLLLFFIIIAVDFGRIFYTTIVVANAAREGARFAISYGIHFSQVSNTLIKVIGEDSSTYPPCTVDNKSYMICKAVIDEAKAAGITVTGDHISIDCLPSGTCTGGQPVRVTVTANFWMFFSDFFSNQPLTITRAVEMMIPSGGN